LKVANKKQKKLSYLIHQKENVQNQNDSATENDCQHQHEGEMKEMVV